MENLLDFDYNKYRKKAGIYRIFNKKNGKSYIGQSINLGLRIYAHLLNIRKGSSSQVIYKAVKKHGIESFCIEILTILPQHEKLKENLDLCEKIYIYYYKSYTDGYNSTVGGDGGILGYRMSDDEKLKRSLAQKGKPKDPLVINKKAKTVYLYNIYTGIYIIASSSFDAAAIAEAYGYIINPGCIQDCARWHKHTTKNFVCAYNLDDLKYRINYLKKEKICKLK